MNLEQFLRGKYLGDKSLAGTRECFPGNVNNFMGNRWGNSGNHG